MCYINFFGLLLGEFPELFLGLELLFGDLLGKESLREAKMVFPDARRDLDGLGDPVIVELFDYDPGFAILVVVYPATKSFPAVIEGIDGERVLFDLNWWSFSNLRSRDHCFR